MAFVDEDAKRAIMLARRLIEGLNTLDDKGRLRVFEELTREFCITCGNAAHKGPCEGPTR